MDFQQYQRRQKISELRPYVPGEDLTGVSISDADREKGSPKAGDMIARNPKDYHDKWLMAAEYFAENFNPKPTLPTIAETKVGSSRTPTDDQSAILEETMSALLAIFNAAPDEMKASVSISFMTTMVMNTPDPWETYNQYGALVAEGIAEFIERRRMAN